MIRVIIRWPTGRVVVFDTEDVAHAALIQRLSDTVWQSLKAVTATILF